MTYLAITLTNLYVPTQGNYLFFTHGVNFKATMKRKASNKIARRSRKINGGGK